MSRLFGAYVVVDWSASEAKKTGEQSVWIGVVKRDVRLRLGACEKHNPPTRAEGEKLLRTLLADLHKRGDRVLVGFDFCLGFPRGTAERLKLKGDPWSALWGFCAQNIVDKADNTNNRFAVAAKINRLMTDEAYPFWGAPARQTQRWLASTKPETIGDIPELRLTELATRQHNPKAAAKSIWQMHGAGAVGGQSLIGMAAVKKLVDDLGPSTAVWPFGTGFRTLTPGDVEPLSALVVEVYPSLFPVTPDPGEVKDAAQVRATTEALARLDEAGKLGQAFAAPAGLSPEDLAIAEREEGWILGA